jgi:hypothetical protein
VAWLAESLLVSGLVYQMGLPVFMSGFLANIIFVEFHFLLDWALGKHVRRNRAEMHLGAQLLNIAASMPFITGAGITFWTYPILHSLAHLVWNLDHSKLARAGRLSFDRSADLELRHAMMKPKFTGEDNDLAKREIEVIEISAPEQMSTLVKNAVAWQNASSDVWREVIFVVDRNLMQAAENQAYSAGLNPNRASFVRAEEKLTLNNVLRKANGMTHLSARVALFATSDRWIDGNDLSLPDYVVGIVRYLVNVLDQTVTPIETHLKAARSAQQAA